MSHIDLDNDNKTTKSGFYVTYRLQDEGENDMQVIRVYMYIRTRKTLINHVDLFRPYHLLTHILTCIYVLFQGQCK